MLSAKWLQQKTGRRLEGKFLTEGRVFQKELQVQPLDYRVVTLTGARTDGAPNG
jgi:hypothetical protein